MKTRFSSVDLLQEPLPSLLLYRLSMQLHDNPNGKCAYFLSASGCCVLDVSSFFISFGDFCVFAKYFNRVFLGRDGVMFAASRFLSGVKEALDPSALTDTFPEITVHRNLCYISNIFMWYDICSNNFSRILLNRFRSAEQPVRTLLYKST